MGVPKIKNKTKIITIIILLMLLFVNYISLSFQPTVAHDSTDQTIFTPEDEGDHFPCACEWWTFHVSLVLENGIHWDVLLQFQYETNQTNRSDLNKFILFLYCFNRDNGKMLDFTVVQTKKNVWEQIPFYFKKNMIDLKYYNCTMRGLYPNYTVYIENIDKSFTLSLSINATSLPHWVAQEASNGYFPWGLGWARYGFIPRLNASGFITIEGMVSVVSGSGYFEHVWGNFTYGLSKKPLSNLKDLVKHLRNVLPFVRWVLSEQIVDYQQPELMINNENFFGYEWAWAMFDNGWNVHMGVFHVMDSNEGPMYGELALTDGKTYWDFADITVKYRRFLYIEETDTYAPLDIEITARNKGGDTLHLLFNTTTEPFLSGIGPLSRFSCGSGGMQTVGVVEGYYTTPEHNISLHGNCTIAMYRQFIAMKYRSLTIENIRPPQGFGFNATLISHQLNFKLFFELQLLPYIKYHFDVKSINSPSPEKPPQQPYNGLILYVGGSGYGNYSHIQDAIDNASVGDTVFVSSGEYRENIVIDKAIRLKGEDKNRVLLHAGIKDGIKVISNSVEITGFTIEALHANNYDDSAIDLSSSGNYVHDNIITKSEWYGIFIFNSSYNIIENNSIIDNDVGLWLCRATNNIIQYNNISLSNFTGIWLWPDSKCNTISNNNFIGNKVNARNHDVTTRNTWSHNYWDDYIGLNFKPLVDLNDDGVGLIPYKISRYNRDFHPLLEPLLLEYS